MALPPAAMVGWLFLASIVSRLVLGERAGGIPCLLWLAGAIGSMILAKHAVARLAGWQYSRGMQQAIESGGPEPTEQYRIGLQDCIYAWESLFIWGFPVAIAFIILVLLPYL